MRVVRMRRGEAAMALFSGAWAFAFLRTGDLARAVVLAVLLAVALLFVRRRTAASGLAVAAVIAAGHFWLGVAGDNPWWGRHRHVPRRPVGRTGRRPLRHRQPRVHPRAVALVALFAAYRPRLAETAPRAATAAVAGAGLALLGNVVEFWGGLLQDQPLSATSRRIGAEAYWIGSDVGFALFAAGVLILAVATIVATRGTHLDRATVRAIRYTGPGVLVAFLALDAGPVVTAAVTTMLAALWLTTLRSSTERSTVAA